MGLRSFFGFSSEGNDTMGPAGTEAQEKSRRDRFEESGHASSGTSYSDPEIITNPVPRQRRSHRD